MRRELFPGTILLIAAGGLHVRAEGPIVWRFDAGAKITAAPCVAGDLVCIGDWAGVLHALERNTGRERWTAKLHGFIPRAATLADGVLYASSYRGKVYALDPGSGARRWMFDAGCSRLYASPMVADGVVYVGDRCGRFFAIAAADGKEIARHESVNWVMAEACATGDAVYLGRMDWSIYALRPRTLEVIWRHPTRTSVLCTPTVAGQTVFCGSDDGNLYALSRRDGREQWRYQTTGWVQSRPVVHEGRVLFGSFDGSLYCLDARSGVPQWQFRTDGHVAAATAVGDGVCYIGSYDGNVYAIDLTTGALRWRFRTGGPVLAAPVLHDGMLLAASTDGRLYAIDTRRSPTDDAPPGPPAVVGPSPADAAGGPPPMATTEKTLVLFFDLAELEEVCGLEHVLHPGEKLSPDPVLVGTPGTWDAARCKVYGDVFVDERTSQWRMWYAGTEDLIGGEGGGSLRTSRHVGYATSRDGVHWDKPDLGIVDYAGSKRNNLVALDGQAAQILDVRDIPGAKKRWRMYTMSFWKSNDPDGGMQTHFRARESDDGLHWEDVARIPVFLDVATVLLDRDAAPALRFKAYGQFYGSDAIERQLGMATSEDGIRWSAARVILSPFDRGAGESEGHFMGVTRYGPYYIALYDTQYSNHSTATELAISRDGLRFQRLFPGQKLIPLGRFGAYDSSMITISDGFVTTAHRFYQYYAAADRNYQEGPRNGLKQPWRRHTGLRVWRREGFTSLRVPAANDGGSILTRPIQVENPEASLLVLNVHAPDETAVAVSILDAETGRPVPGYESSDPARGVDRVRHVVTFGGRDSLSGLAAAHQVRLRVTLSATGAEVFALGFERRP
jgi:outer membrane protein assembly factor BamB